MTFPASPFELESVRQISVAALRVTFTQYPKALDPAGSDDALNPGNYELTGPNSNFVVSCSTVDSDRQSIDLYLAAPLAVGSWTIEVANIVEDTSESLMPPVELDFIVTATMVSDPLGHGAVNPEQENILRKFLNPALVGPGWDSMISALSVADQRNADNARLAFDQLFLATASGAYLDRRASDEGIHRPKGVNMSDDLFRQLALTQRNGKLTQKALLDVLEIFYGRDTTRASSDTGTTEAYPLQDGDELVILFEERNTITVTFERSHFSRIGAATAEEVAAAITRACRDAGNQGFAVSFADTISGLNRVRIYSGTLGLTSSVRIIGGRGNTALQFPTPLFEDTTGSPYATWDITFSPDTLGNLRFTMTAGTEYSLFQVQTDDLVYIYGPEFAASANGTYPIQAVKVTSSTQWFEIDNPLGIESTGVVQTKFTDLMFFRPKRRSVYDNTRRVIVCENDGYLDIVIPATTEVVDRGPGLAAYLNEALPIPSSNIAVVRTADGVVSVNAFVPHGLSVGDQIIVDEAYPDGGLPGSVPSTPSGDFPGPDSTAAGITAASLATTATQTGSYAGVWSKAVRDSEGRILILGGWTTTDGVTVVPSTEVTVLEKSGETVGGHGGRSVNFLWTQISNDGTHGFSGYNSGPRAFSASLLGDGRVFCVGGTSNLADLSTSGFAGGWDMFTFIPPNMISQQSSGSLPGIGAGHAQASFIDGSDDALITGGYVTTTPNNLTFRFVNSSNNFSGLSTMKIARYNHAMVALDDQINFLVIGGRTNLDGSTWIDSSDGIATDLAGHGMTSFPGTLQFCELYDSGADEWRSAGNMTYARSNFGTVKLPDGRVIVFGGSGYLPESLVVAPKVLPAVLSSVEIYDPDTNIWAALPAMQHAREYPVCVYMPDSNEVWVTSGAPNVVVTEVLDVATMKWRAPSQGSIQTARQHATGGLLDADLFVTIGGDNGTATGKINHILVPGADQFWYGPGINGFHRVETVPEAATFTYSTREYDYGRSFTNTVQGQAVVTPERANPAPETVPGPFSYDPVSGFAITATAGTTDTAFNKGGRYTSMHLEGVDSALAFPDEVGWLVFNFGYKNVVGPIRYLGRLSNEDLILDAAVPFSSSLPAGASVRLLTGREAFEPAADQLVGNFYVTGTAAGREAAHQIIDDIIAAGKQVLVTIVYPGDRGLGAEGFPQGSNYKLSDVVEVFGGDQLDSEIPAARQGP